MKVKRGDKVRTLYGGIETVMFADEWQVITYESARKQTHYHPTKVWKI